MTLDELIQRSHATAREKGFWDSPNNDSPTKKAEKTALMHSELSEMLEGIRKPGSDEHCPLFTKEEIELADLLIRAADYAGYYGLRLQAAIEAKMHYNLSRPYKHGKAM